MTTENAQTVTQRINNLIQDQMGSALVIGEPGPETLFEDLGMDSLDRVELVMGLEDEFELEIQDEECASWKTVGDVIKFIEAKGLSPSVTENDR